MSKGGRRPSDGSFPLCPKSGICRAQSIRNHSACRNCALSDISLHDYITDLGTPEDLFMKIKQNCKPCLDLLTRVIDSYNGDQSNPNFEKIVFILFHFFGNGNISPKYLGKPLAAPRPSDAAHARMILEELKLTCYEFNADTDICEYIEDIIYCKRHTPILSVNVLNKMCTKYERNRNRKRKYPTSLTITDIKQCILNHEKNKRQKNPKFKEIPLRKRFNNWLRKLSKPI